MRIVLTREKTAVYPLGPADERLTVEIEGQTLRTYTQERQTGSTIDHRDVAADIAKAVGAQEHYKDYLARVERCEMTAEGFRVRGVPDKAAVLYHMSLNQLGPWLESLGHRFKEKMPDTLQIP